MLRVFVLGKTKTPLMPCNAARARELLKLKKARVFTLKPFTIILTEREGGETQAIESKVDPGSKRTGIALVGNFKRGRRVVFALNLEHRGQQIKDALESRGASRRSRRQRKTRYREPRFDNRRRPEGWLPPSLMSRVYNVENWTRKMFRRAPISSIFVETVRFDTQKMQHPEMSGIEYQQGELFGYEIREYLLEKWDRKCAYCDAGDCPLEVEHIVPKSKGGTNRISNLTLACTRCNTKKANQSVKDFVKDKARLRTLLCRAKSSLKDTAAVNATRFAIGNILKKFQVPISFWSGGRTKYNRSKQGYAKDHWIDAACVGDSGGLVYICKSLRPLEVKAEARGSRQKCRMDCFRFPRTSAKGQKTVRGFRTGDVVKAIVPKGKKTGTYVGRVAVRSTGNFNVKVNKKTVQGINFQCCQIIQRADGYSYV